MIALVIGDASQNAGGPYTGCNSFGFSNSWPGVNCGSAQTANAAGSSSYPSTINANSLPGGGGGGGGGGPQFAVGPLAGAVTNDFSSNAPVVLAIVGVLVVALTLALLFMRKAVKV